MRYQETPSVPGEPPSVSKWRENGTCLPLKFQYEKKKGSFMATEWSHPKIRFLELDYIDS